MSLDQWEPFFKPEARSAGNTLVGKGVVNVARGSDTEVQCYIRGSSPFKVNFRSDSIESSDVSANCTCPQGKKGQFCKHMWAALVEIAEKNPDFLESKTNLEHDANSRAKGPSEASIPSVSQNAYTAKRADYAAAQKVKQSEYRKQQYQKQKDKLDLKKGKAPKVTSPVQVFPEDVEASLNYFSQNGFEFREDLNSEAVSVARKQLARVFHPDKGGSHDEILELNMHTDTLLDFLDAN